MTIACSCTYQIKTVDGRQVVTLLTQCDAHLDAALMRLADYERLTAMLRLALAALDRARHP